MSYPVVRISTSSATRQPTPALWRDTLEAFDANTYDPGVLIDDDFNQPVTHAEDAVVNGWLLTDAAAGGTPTAATTAARDGVKDLTDAGGTAHFGANLVWANSSSAVANICLPSHATVALRGGRLVFETYIDSLSTDVYFIGLTDIGADFLSSSSALGDKNYIGFFKAEAGDLSFVTSDTGVGAQVSDSAVILSNANVPSGFYKVGFAVNKDRSVEIFVNEVGYPVAAASINRSALPTVALVPRFEVTAGGSTATVSLLIDWVKIFSGNA